LAECCRKEGVHPRFGYALRKDPKVKALIEDITAKNAMQGVVVGENKMLRRMAEEGSVEATEIDGEMVYVAKPAMKDSDLVKFTEHFRKVQGGGFEHKDTGQNVLVQVNLPQPASYAAPARAEARVVAESEFGELLESKEDEDE
jgi:hypothetical protein